MAIVIACPTHRAYKAKRQPRTGCDCCWKIWWLVHNTISRWPKYVLRWTHK